MAAAIGIAKTATEIFLGVGEVSIDNLTFKLFYKWTVTMFIVSSVLVSTSQFFGDPIQCETVSESGPKEKAGIKILPFSLRGSVIFKFLGHLDSNLSTFLFFLWSLVHGLNKHFFDMKFLSKNLLL